MNMGQMVEDVRLALEGSGEVHFYGRPGGIIPTPLELSRVITSQYYQKRLGVSRKDEEGILKAKLPEKGPLSLLSGVRPQHPASTDWGSHR